MSEGFWHQFFFGFLWSQFSFKKKQIPSNIQRFEQAGANGADQRFAPLPGLDPAIS